MEGKIVFLILADVLFCMVEVSGYYDTYRGAVVEYNPVVTGTEQEHVAKNVMNYKKFMTQANAKKVDIIVFPEGGLFTRTIASEIPDPIDEITPCDGNFSTTQAVKDLSCASRDNKIYTVINLLEKRKCEPDEEDCPKVGYYIYNTNVVFDRKGTVIARYAKYNLYDEGNTQRPKNPEFVFFDTDFGVRFGTFICFDILFQTPTLRLIQQYHITDFVFTTFWFSELPFLTATQVQSGWAESNNVNLLASGVNMVNFGSTGSGIFNGKFGQLVKTFCENTTSKLLVANIPKIKNSCSVDTCKTVASDIRLPPRIIPPEIVQTKEQGPETRLFLKKDFMSLFQSEVIEPWKTFDKTICSAGNFCCDFHVELNSFTSQANNYTYRAVVFNGVRKFGKSFRGGLQVCGVVLCNGPNLMNCTDRVPDISKLFQIKDIRIRGDFKLRNSFQMPSTLTDEGGIAPLPFNAYEFRKTEKKDSVEVYMELLWSPTNLRTFAIWGRDFARDNETEMPISGTSFIAPVPCLFATLVAFVLFSR